ncbi:MAG: hypothetical protein QMC73_03120 [Myxococcota bacterium]
MLDDSGFLFAMDIVAQARWLHPISVLALRRCLARVWSMFGRREEMFSSA